MTKFYITTAIDYVNSRPHVGTAYEKIVADAIARYRRLRGDDVFFAMGTDEHSLNVQREAERRGLTPKAYCDEMAVAFEETWSLLGISYDTFIRTTEARHEKSVRALFEKIVANKDPETGQSDIYPGVYRGPYCTSCEAFYQEKDLVDGKCPTHGTIPPVIEEKNWFFRLTRYREDLLRAIEEPARSSGGWQQVKAASLAGMKRILDGEEPHHLSIEPEARRNEILNVLKGGLEDISVSRSGATWGIPLPKDPSQVVYVWFDALINYLSAIGFQGESQEELARFDRYWPANLHVIGKDITRFHCIIWPAMLLSAGVPLPRSVFGHGFITVNGQKLSKSLGNVVDPAAIVERFGADALRYFLLREIVWGQDGDFSWEQLERRYNADLANDLGNLLSRTLSMAERYLGGEVRLPEPPDPVRRLRDAARTSFNEAHVAWQIDQFALALGKTWDLVRLANQHIEQTAPWALAKDPAKRDTLATVLYDLLESLRIVARLIAPAMPTKAQEIWTRIGQAGDIRGGPPKERHGEPLVTFADLPVVRSDEGLGIRDPWSERTPFRGLRAGPPLFPKRA